MQIRRGYVLHDINITQSNDFVRHFREPGASPGEIFLATMSETGSGSTSTQARPAMPLWCSNTIGGFPLTCLIRGLKNCELKKLT